MQLGHAASSSVGSEGSNLIPSSQASLFSSISVFFSLRVVCLGLGLRSKVPLHCDIPRHYSQQPLLSFYYSTGITALPAASSAAAAAAAAAHTRGCCSGKNHIHTVLQGVQH